MNSQQASVRPLMDCIPHVSAAEPLEHPSTAGFSAPPEEALLHFDVEEDLAAVIPMPPTIPPSVRAAITKAACARFMFADELDDWLHATDDGLGGRTPFEALVDGEGGVVLAALVGDRSGHQAGRRILLLPDPGDQAESEPGGGHSAAAA